jgi:hypothetical protein
VLKIVPQGSPPDFARQPKIGNLTLANEKLDALRGRLGKTLRRCRCLGAGKGEEGGSGGQDQRRLAGVLVYIVIFNGKRFILKGKRGGDVSQMEVVDYARSIIVKSLSSQEKGYAK